MEWRDQIAASIGSDSFWTGSIYMEVLKAAWAELWFHVSVINIRPFYFKTDLINYDATERYDFGS